MLIAIWIFCGVLSAAIITSKGHGIFSGFSLGIILGPIGVIIALFTKTKEEEDKEDASKGIENETYKKCPYCAEVIKKEAIKCRYCQSELPGKNSDVPEVGRINNQE